MSARSLELPGIDGANPLGFLAALGTLTTLRQAGEEQARLGWKRAHTFVPVLDGLSTSDAGDVSTMVAGTLRGRQVSQEDEKNLDERRRDFDAAKKKVEDQKKQIGPNERKAAVEQEVLPLEKDRDEKRREWLNALAKAVPRPELAIGKRIDCTYQEYREHADDFLVGAGHSDRETLDLLAAFGSDACRDNRSDAIESTPFCFIRGSGHQYFLDTVRQLTEKVSGEAVRQTLFEPWTYRDKGLSMRWDPVEDRRYALMDRDPTAPGNESRTVWMANLLAYRALPLFPCTAQRRGLATTAWGSIDDQEKDLAFTWPIWEFAAPPDTIRSLLQLSELIKQRPDRSALRARGVAAVYRARRIKVGDGRNFKLNFSPARTIS